MKHTLLALGLSCAFVACDKAPNVDEDEYPSGPDADPIVEVTDEGSGDKRALRLQPEVGTSQSVRLNMTMSGDQLPSPISIDMDMRAEVTEIESNGDFRIEMTIVDASMGGVPGAGGSIGDMLRDIEFTGTMSARGEMADFEVEGSMMGQMDSLVDQSMSGVKFALPEAEVGVGSSWEMRTVEQQQGMRVFQTASFTVASIDGDLVELELKLDQRARDQKIETGIQTADLDYLQTEGGGTMTLDLSKPMPVRSQLDADMNMKVSVGDQSQQADMSLDISLSPI